MTRVAMTQRLRGVFRHSLRAFLEDDLEVDSIRLRASGVDLPVNAEGERELLALADEADRLAEGNVS